MWHMEKLCPKKENEGIGERGEKLVLRNANIDFSHEVITSEEVISVSFSFLFRIIYSSLVFNPGNVFLPFFPFFLALFFALLSLHFFKTNLPPSLEWKTTRGPDGGPYLLRCQNHVWFIPSLFEVLQRGISSLLSIVVHRLNQTLTFEIWNLGKRSGKE